MRPRKHSNYESIVLHTTMSGFERVGQFALHLPVSEQMHLYIEVPDLDDENALESLNRRMRSRMPDDKATRMAVVHRSPEFDVDDAVIDVWFPERTPPLPASATIPLSDRVQIASYYHTPRNDFKDSIASLVDFVTPDYALPELVSALCEHRIPVRLKHPPPEPLLLIGASAGGVDAFQEVLRNMEGKVDLPVVLLLHRRRDGSAEESQLQPILSRCTSKPVVIPNNGDEPKPGHIYMAKPLHHLILKNSCFFHVQEEDSTWCPSIDQLFMSAAMNYGPRAIGALLTGRLNDGVEGLRTVTEYGGISIVQEPLDASSPCMPINAILGDHPNYVVALSDFGLLMEEITTYPFPRGLSNQSIALKAAVKAAELKRHAEQGEQPPTTTHPTDC